MYKKATILIISLLLNQTILAAKIDSLSRNDTSFTKENFVKYLKDKGIKYQDIVIAQSILESDNFRSRIFKENNNLFGMTKAEHRASTALPSKSKYAKYVNWQSSVDDFLLFQLSIKCDTREQYIRFIKNNYSTNKSYLKMIYFRIKKFKLNKLIQT